MEGALSGAASPKEYLVGIEVFDRAVDYGRSSSGSASYRKKFRRLPFLTTFRVESILI